MKITVLTDILIYPFYGYVKSFYAKKICTEKINENFKIKVCDLRVIRYVV